VIDLPEQYKDHLKGQGAELSEPKTVEEEWTGGVFKRQQSVTYCVIAF